MKQKFLVGQLQAPAIWEKTDKAEETLVYVFTSHNQKQESF